MSNSGLLDSIVSRPPGSVSPRPIEADALMNHGLTADRGIWTRPRPNSPVVSPHTTGFPRPLGILLNGARRDELERHEAAFRHHVDHRLRTGSLDHLEVGEPIGEGGAKKAFELPGTDCVLVVDGKKGSGLLEEIMNLHRLSAVGVPVAELKDFGTYQGREAMVMERLHDVTKPSSPDTFSGSAFVNSTFANGRTIDSLVQLRNAIVREKINVIDLQYGFTRNGSLRVFDPLAILTSNSGLNNKPMVETLDRLVAALNSKFERRRQPA